MAESVRNSIFRSINSILFALIVLSACGKDSGVAPSPGNVSDSKPTQLREENSWSLRMIVTCPGLAPDGCVGGYGFSVTEGGSFVVGPGPAGQMVSGKIGDEELQRLRQLLSKDAVQSTETCLKNDSYWRISTTISLDRVKDRIRLIHSTSDEFCFKMDSINRANQVLEEFMQLANRYYTLSVKAITKNDHDGTGYRVNCKFLNGEKHPGVKQCSSIAAYKAQKSEFTKVRMTVNCDDQILFHGDGVLNSEPILDRISPIFAATPAIELYPAQQLYSEGVYLSVLDIQFGRMKGSCRVSRE